MGQKKNTKETSKSVEVKSAAAGKIKKKKKQTQKEKKNITVDSTIMAQMAENVQKVMESTNGEKSRKRKQEKVSVEKSPNSKVANKNGQKSKGAKNEQKNNKNNKKQKKNHTDTKKETTGKETTESLNKDDDNNEAKWSKSKKKRIRALKAKQLKKQQPDTSSKSPVDPQDGDATKDSESSSNVTSTAKSSKLQDAFKARLSGSRFRILNEELYTQDSKDSFQRFSENPQLFEEYHQGFRHQVASWPVNPVDIIVRWIVNRFSGNKKVVVADFGCGDAQLAKDLIKQHERFKVHSFDLVSPDPKLVTACDMANVPLEDKSVDVVVFSLALMGTNLADFIREAHRVLKDNGRVQIAEVRSRIEYSHGRNKKGGGGADSTLSGTLDEFIKVLSQLGFECAKTDRSNTMFLFLELKKNGKAPNKKLEFSAKPCIYKRR